MKEKFYRFMQGRYGVDTLNKHFTYIVLLIAIINMFLHSYILTIVNYVLILLLLYRMFSKDTYKRYQENVRYEKAFKPYIKHINVLKRNISDKQYKYFVCPNCSQIVRVPRKKGKVEVTCPKCHQHFDKRT